MTTKDKTEEKLVASMRRTKAGAAKPATTATDAKSQATRSATAASTNAATTKAAPKRKPAASRKTTAGTSTAAATQVTPGDGDSYQSAGRIWPD